MSQRREKRVNQKANIQTWRNVQQSFLIPQFFQGIRADRERELGEAQFLLSASMYWLFINVFITRI